MLTASSGHAPTSSAIPTTNGNRSFCKYRSCVEEVLEMEYGYSKYMNVQTVTIQEMPERSPYGQVCFLRFPYF